MKLKAGEWIVLAGAILIIGFSVMVGTIIYVKPPPVQYTYLETEKTVHGETMYRHSGCASCHELFGNGTSGFGPKLDGVGSRRTKQWLIRYLGNPWPGVSDKKYRLKMPPVSDLTSQELDALAQYLSALRSVDSSGQIIEPTS